MEFRVFGSGHLAKDPIKRQTKSGKTVAEMVLISNRRGKKAREAGLKDDVTFVLWDRQADIACEFLKKGMRPTVAGVLRVDHWTDNNGQKRKTTRVFVADLELPVKQKGAAPAVEPTDVNAAIDDIDESDLANI